MPGLARRRVADIGSRLEAWQFEEKSQLAVPGLLRSLVVDSKAVGWADVYQGVEAGDLMSTSYTGHAELVAAGHSLEVELTELE